MTNITVNSEKTSFTDAVLWCHQNFGKQAFDVNYQFPSNWLTFKFNNPEHATLFALKWQ
jgi:hypothetical protein